jgi:phosphoglycerate dehydrogenase-like enzyme
MSDAPQPQPVVLVTEGSDPKPLAWLKERAQVVEIPQTDPNFLRELAGADGMVVRTYTRVTDELLAHAPRLRVIGRGGVGLDNIDLAACRRRNIQVVYTPDANTLAVGDYIFGILLRLIREWPFLSPGYDPGSFRKTRDRLKGKQLDELTLGILGLGRVGKRVARIASAGFGMRVIYNDLIDAGPLPFDAKGADKPTLFRECDVLTIHVDMRHGNEHLVGAEQIAMMKRGSILLNASRGEVLDAHALAEALRSGHLAAAAIDVYAPEPPPADLELIGMPNLLLTPHIASRTTSATENMGWVVRDVIGVLHGQAPQYPAPQA